MASIFPETSAMSVAKKNYQPRQLVSDGKRPRAVWRTGDGDGESEYYYVERSMTSRHGHPTWRLYIEKVTLPIVRGSEEEPPRYVYLDDRACFDIWNSRLYTADELHKHWPFDYDKAGNIKMGRPNRGFPSYADEANEQYNMGKIRTKGKFYTFSGASKGADAPAREKYVSKITKEVTAEFAAEARRKKNMELQPKDNAPVESVTTLSQDTTMKSADSTPRSNTVKSAAPAPSPGPVKPKARLGGTLPSPMTAPPNPTHNIHPPTRPSTPRHINDHAPPKHPMAGTLQYWQHMNHPMESPSKRPRLDNTQPRVGTNQQGAPTARSTPGMALPSSSRPIIQPHVQMKGDTNTPPTARMPPQVAKKSTSTTLSTPRLTPHTQIKSTTNTPTIPRTAPHVQMKRNPDTSPAQTQPLSRNRLDLDRLKAQLAARKSAKPPGKPPRTSQG